MPSNQDYALLLIPFGFLALLWLDYEEQKTIEQKTGFMPKKEALFLRYNKDEMFKNFLAIEGHLRNVKEDKIDDKGFMNCAVKHSADAEWHADEAICHSLAIGEAETSEKFKQLRDEIQEFRHELQEGKVSASEGIEKVRTIRHEFESFNPDFDVSKCQACEVHE